MHVNDSDETSDQVAATIRALAADAFAGHEVIRRGDREWLCKRPGTGVYHFTLIARRGVLIVFGDIGDWILSMSSDDPVAWAARAVGSPDYFFEKLQASKDGGRAFYPADMKAWIQGQVGQMEATDPAAERYWKALDRLQDRQSEWDHLSHEMAVEVLSELGFDDIGSIGVAPSARCFWLLEAMRWFTARMAATDSAAEQAPPGGGG